MDHVVGVYERKLIWGNTNFLSIRWKVGKGYIICFWQDKWAGEARLKD